MYHKVEAYFWYRLTILIRVDDYNYNYKCIWLAAYFFHIIILIRLFSGRDYAALFLSYNDAFEYVDMWYVDDDDGDGDDGDIDLPVVINIEFCHLVCEVMIHCCDVEHLLSQNWADISVH